MSGRVRFLSLRTSLVLLVGALVFALAAALLLVLPRRVDALSQAWADRKLLGVGRAIASTLPQPFDAEDPAAAAAALQRLDAIDGALFGALVREDGAVLARWNDPPPTIDLRGASGAEVEHHDHVVIVRAPVRLARGPRARLVLGFSPAGLWPRPRETLRWMASGAVLALAAGMGLAWLIGTLVTRPLRRTTLVAERIAHGDLTASNDLETARGDEAGALARAFEAMLARLYEQQLAVARKNSELGQKVAELKAAQEQLVFADRRIGVGRLAAGIAHEVNNPLAYLRSNVEFAARTVADLRRSAAGGARGEALAEPLESVGQALADADQGADRIGHIVRGLKTFARDDGDRRAPLPVTRPLEAALDMAGGEIKRRATLSRRYGDAPLVEASEVRLSQVFLNLLLNAAQAIPGGAPHRHAITVRTGTDARGWAVVEVEDSGCGIAPEARRRLFEAFFTTKPEGVGTGLGLSVSQGIVTALGGRIEVRSEVGRGSTFAVVLPPAASAPAQAEVCP